MSLRAYAKHRGVSQEAVRRAIGSGRLEGVVVKVRGAPKIADIELADRLWAKNTRPRADRPALQAATSEDLPPAPDPDSYSEARRRRELENWHQARIKREMDELDLAARQGKLVSVAEVEGTLATEYAAVRAKLLGLPARVKQRLPHIVAADVLVIDDLVREALEALADGAE